MSKDVRIQSIYAPNPPDKQDFTVCTSSKPSQQQVYEEFQKIMQEALKRIQEKDDEHSYDRAMEIFRKKTSKYLNELVEATTE